MLTSVKIENLRGIEKGELGRFAPLTILTGPNGCGKSTVLDAILIGLARVPAEEIARVVRRRPRLFDGARWLFGNSRQPAAIAVDGLTVFQAWGLDWRRVASESTPKEWRSTGPPFSVISVRDPALAESSVLDEFYDRRQRGPVVAEILFSGDGEWLSEPAKTGPKEGLPELHLIDPGLPLALDDLFSDAVRQGRRKEVQDFLRQLVPELETLEILKEKEEGSQLYIVTSTGAVPVATSGDGIQSFAQLAIELAAIPEGLAHDEEPEVYQHPRAIRQSALALLVALRRGVQVVVSTHSLELIDAILGQAKPEDLANIALFNLALEKGQLRSSRSSGDDLVFARRQLEHDLR
jgi:hypothetical protein